LKIKGKVFKFGDNIDTDQIYPGRYLELTEHKKIAKHAMEGVDPNFVKKVNKGDIIVAGNNFGCGSSREHAVITLKEAGVNTIIAESFARIFFRNCINLGLPALICSGITREVKENDILKVNLKKGSIYNINNKKELKGEHLSERILNILNEGGIKPLLKNS